MTPFFPTRRWDGLEIFLHLYQDLFGNLIARHKCYISNSAGGDTISGYLDVKTTDIEKVGGKAVVNVIIAAVHKRLPDNRDIGFCLRHAQGMEESRSTRRTCRATFVSSVVQLGFLLDIITGSKLKCSCRIPLPPSGIYTAFK